MGTLNLINAIEAGDSQAIEMHFESAMAERIADRLDTMRVEVAKNMFKEDVDGYDYSDIITESDIEEFMQTEEFEQLDELSKKTLGNYVQKNAISQTSLARKEDELRRTYDAVGKAAMDTRGDASDHLYNAKKVIDKDIDKVRDKQWKRTKGMYTAVKKLTKEDVEAFMQTEEFEQLDELSKKTLGSYVTKAAHNMAVNHGARMTKSAEADEIDRFMNRHVPGGMQPKYKAVDDMKKTLGADNKSIMDLHFKIGKRAKGIDTAVKKLTKEDIDQLEESRVPTGIKLYHKDKEGNENYSIHFSGQDAAKEEKRRKKMGHKTVAHAVMYGKEEGERVDH